MHTSIHPYIHICIYIQIKYYIIASTFHCHRYLVLVNKRIMGLHGIKRKALLALAGTAVAKKEN